jgi:hypothetical protein
MDKTKRGISLFITLLVIASILSIVAVSFSYLEKVQKDAGKVSALIQANLFYKNTTEVLRRFFPKGEADSQKLDMIYTMPLMLTESKSEFNINLQCKPLLVAIPIKWLSEAFTKKFPERMKLARDTLVEILQLYEIDDATRLEEMILEKVDSQGHQGRYISRLGKKGNNITKREFKRTLLDYRLKYHDSKVFKIPWERYFIFTDVSQKATIDGMYLTDELISIVFDIPIEIVKDSRIVERDLEKGIVKKLTLKALLEESGNSSVINTRLFSQKALNAMHCEERFEYRNSSYSFSFDYSNERSTNFEFNGKL